MIKQISSVYKNLLNANKLTQNLNYKFNSSFSKNNQAISYIQQQNYNITNQFKKMGLLQHNQKFNYSQQILRFNLTTIEEVQKSNFKPIQTSEINLKKDQITQLIRIKKYNEALVIIYQLKLSQDISSIPDIVIKHEIHIQCQSGNILAALKLVEEQQQRLESQSPDSIQQTINDQNIEYVVKILDLQFVKASIFLTFQKLPKQALDIYKQNFIVINEICNSKNITKLNEKYKQTLKYVNNIQSSICCHQLKSYTQAIKYVDEALNIDAKNPSGFRLKGNILQAAQYYKDAKQSYDQALELDPQYTLAKNDLNVLNDILKDLKVKEIFDDGVKLAQEKKYLHANEYFDKCLEIDPNNVKALFNKGMNFENLQDIEQALECYQQGIRTSPNEPSFYLSVAKIFNELLQYNDAKDYILKAFELDPKNEKVIYNKFLIFVNLNQYDVAQECLDMGLRLTSNNDDSDQSLPKSNYWQRLQDEFTLQLNNHSKIKPNRRQ